MSLAFLSSGMVILPVMLDKRSPSQSTSCAGPSYFCSASLSPRYVKIARSTHTQASHDCAATASVSPRVDAHNRSSTKANARPPISPTQYCTSSVMAQKWKGEEDSPNSARVPRNSFPETSTRPSALTRRGQAAGQCAAASADTDAPCTALRPRRGRWQSATVTCQKASCKSTFAQ